MSNVPFPPQLPKAEQLRQDLIQKQMDEMHTNNLGGGILTTNQLSTLSHAQIEAMMKSMGLPHQYVSQGIAFPPPQPAVPAQMPKPAKQAAKPDLEYTDSETYFYIDVKNGERVLGQKIEISEYKLLLNPANQFGRTSQTIPGQLYRTRQAAQDALRTMIRGVIRPQIEELAQALVVSAMANGIADEPEMKLAQVMREYLEFLQSPKDTP